MLLAFDLDGTIVTQDRQLSKQTIEAIRAAARQDHHIAVLTGRRRASAAPFVNALGLDIILSTNHGARVRHGAGGVLRAVTMQGAASDALLAELPGNGNVIYSLFADDHLYVKDPTDPQWRRIRESDKYVSLYTPDPSRAYDKMILNFAAGQSRSEVNEAVAKLNPTLLRYALTDGALEILPAGADKGSALAFIAEHLGVPQGEVVAFGDDANDETMIAWAGTGVAVGHSPHPKVLAGAQARVAPPEELGVATWLVEHLL